MYEANTAASLEKLDEEDKTSNQSCGPNGLGFKHNKRNPVKKEPPLSNHVK